ncbi:MAG: flagellar motor switch protein FliG [Deltaproteobacteria bacterium]|nr:flagellar motor switch protein FliG [Deltaproteobacteria bacterium]
MGSGSRVGQAALAGVDKAAVLLLSLGPEAATSVMRHLGESEVRQVSQALARVRSVEPEQLERVHEEFGQRLRASGLVVDGREFARAVVTRALGDGGTPARSAILAEIETQAGGGAGLGDALAGVPAAGLARLLAGEHPQIAALVLANLAAAQAGEVLASLPETLQSDLVERLARLESVPAGLVAEVGSALREQAHALLRPAGTACGGPRVVAELMNCADKTIEARVFEEIEARDPELASTIRNLMFTFEDCIKLDNRGLQMLLKEVAREDLLLALKTVSPDLSAKIFANVSSRAAEILREDMASSGPVKLKDVEAAQLKIIAVLRELEAEGKIVVAGSGKDDVLV